MIYRNKDKVFPVSCYFKSDGCCVKLDNGQTEIGIENKEGMEFKISGITSLLV